MRMLSLHGASHDAWNRYTERGNWYYDVLAHGFKYNLSDIQSAIGIHQLRKLERFVAAARSTRTLLQCHSRGMDGIGNAARSIRAAVMPGTCISCGSILGRSRSVAPNSSVNCGRKESAPASTSFQFRSIPSFRGCRWRATPVPARSSSIHESFRFHSIPR